MANKKLIQVEEWKHSEIFKRKCPAHFCPSRPRFANRPHILGPYIPASIHNEAMLSGAWTSIAQ